MRDIANHHRLREEARPYATRNDFAMVFSVDLSGLYQLAFLLTRDREKAEQCFVAGFEDRVKANPVFREWAHSWAKRTIIQNAIRELKPRPSHHNSSSSASVHPGRQPSSGPGGHFELEAILALADFERFVFVMSVLEHYSASDCSLLLSCSPAEIQEAQIRALEQLTDSVHMVFPQNQVLPRR